ncbi:MAG: hypothetical protein PHW04_06505 [Candidatus Wallbacteria bacterium]|nr:hypothetical protein [Candidatus Wallbacteria bacterium]
MSKNQQISQSKRNHGVNLAVDCMMTVISITYPFLCIGYVVMKTLDMDLGNDAIPIISIIGALIFCPIFGYFAGWEILIAVRNKILNKKKSSIFFGLVIGMSHGMLIGGIVGTAICPVLVMGILTHDMQSISESIIFGTGPGILLGLIIGSIVGPRLAMEEFERHEKKARVRKTNTRHVKKEINHDL